MVVLTRNRGTGLVGGGAARESGGVLGQRCWGHTRRRARGAKAQAPGRLHTAAALRQDTGGFTETYLLIVKLPVKPHVRAYTVGVWRERSPHSGPRALSEMLSTQLNGTIHRRVRGASWSPEGQHGCYLNTCRVQGKAAE